MLARSAPVNERECAPPHLLWLAGVESTRQLRACRASRMHVETIAAANFPRSPLDHVPAGFIQHASGESRGEVCLLNEEEAARRARITSARGGVPRRGFP